MNLLHKTGLLAALALSCGVACGGGSDSPADASPPDAKPVVCKMLPSYPGANIPASINAERSAPAGGTEVVRIGVGFNNEQDGFELQLYAGSGVFASGIKTGTFPLTGAELNYKTCGVCVLAFGDAMGPSPPNPPAEEYFATAGTVEITEVGPTGAGNLKATLKGIKFEHVTINQTTAESTPVNDGCKTEFTSDMVINSPIVAAPMMKRGASPPWMHIRK